MKKLIILLLYLSTAIYPQWVLQTSPTNKTLRSIKAINENVLWACGYNGVVIKTVDGGNIWTRTKDTDSTYNNVSIAAVDSNTAWVTGTKAGFFEAKIWKTTDGGKSWSEKWYNPSAYSNDMKFIDSLNGIAFLDYGVSSAKWLILKTTDGGENWNKVPESNTPEVDSLNNELGLESSLVTFENNIWFVAYSDVDTRIYYSTDMGENWSKTESLIPEVVERSLYLAPVTESKLVAVGGGGIRGFSEDGGVNWSFPTTANLGLFVKNVIKLPGTNTLIAVGNFGRSRISKDLGQTWTTIPQTHENKSLRAIEAVSANTVWCAGDSGYIYKWNVPSQPVGVKELVDAGAPSDFVVNQNYPNPFNPSTSIAYGLPFESNVKVTVYNPLGQMISELVNQVQPAGYYEVNWNAGNASTGTYFYVITATPLNNIKEFTSVKKMLLVK